MNASHAVRTRSGRRAARSAPAAMWLLAGLILLLLLVAPVLGKPQTPALITFTVNSTLDQPDTDYADGVCKTAAGTCTLRAAIMQADATSGEGALVNVPAGNYLLTRPAIGENGPESGDLNLTSPMKDNPVIYISGAGPGKTVIDANKLDRVINVEEGRVASIAYMTIRNGYLNAPDETAEGAGILNLGSLTLVEVDVRDHRIMATGGTARGGGIASRGSLLLSESSVTDNVVYGYNAEGAGLYLAGATMVEKSTIGTSLAFGDESNNHEGGGIYIPSNQAKVEIRESVVSENDATYGGGIFSAGTNVLIMKTAIAGNESLASGGGLYNSGVMTFGESLFEGNEAPYGAGIFNAGQLAFYQGSIMGNTVPDGADPHGGGAVYNSNTGEFNATASTLAGNHASYGGAFYNSGSLFLVNSTLSENVATGSGGAVFNDGVTNAYNTTFVANQADADRDGQGEGGGMFGNNGDFNIRNVLMAGNYTGAASAYDECAGVLTLYGANVVGILTLDGDSVSCTRDILHGSSKLLNGLDTLGPLAANGGPTLTHALLPGSNAIDAGDPAGGCVDFSSTPLVTDQRGYERVAGVRCDVGAFEYRPLIFIPIARR